MIYRLDTIKKYINTGTGSFYLKDALENERSVAEQLAAIIAHIEDLQVQLRIRIFLARSGSINAQIRFEFF